MVYSANAMLFTRWRHHIRFGSGFPYALFEAMLTKISKWSRIQESFWITTKIESLVVFAIPDIRWKFRKDLSITFRVILLTDRQTNSGKKTSLAEVIISVREWTFHANFTVGNESSRGRKFLGMKVPGNESSQEWKFQGTKVPEDENST